MKLSGLHIYEYDILMYATSYMDITGFRARIPRGQDWFGHAGSVLPQQTVWGFV